MWAASCDCGIECLRDVSRSNVLSDDAAVSSMQRSCCCTCAGKTAVQAEPPFAAVHSIPCTGWRCMTRPCTTWYTQNSRAHAVYRRSAKNCTTHPSVATALSPPRTRCASASACSRSSISFSACERRMSAWQGRVGHRTQGTEVRARVCVLARAHTRKHPSISLRAYERRMGTCVYVGGGQWW